MSNTDEQTPQADIYPSQGYTVRLVQTNVLYDSNAADRCGKVENLSSILWIEGVDFNQKSML
jgi:hypothetical protein